MRVGDKLEFEYMVMPTDSAKALSIDIDDEFPEVLATSRMIALMELASARLMKELLDEDQLSVGVGVNVRHIAPTSVGSIVRSISEYKGMEGKLYTFKVSIYDDLGLAGNGLHTRAIINTRRLLESSKKRN